MPQVLQNSLLLPSSGIQASGVQGRRRTRSAWCVMLWRCHSLEHGFQLEQKMTIIFGQFCGWLSDLDFGEVLGVVEVLHVGGRDVEVVVWRKVLEVVVVRQLLHGFGFSVGLECYRPYEARSVGWKDAEGLAS